MESALTPVGVVTSHTLFFPLPLLSCPCCWVHCPCAFPRNSNPWPCDQHVRTRSNSSSVHRFCSGFPLVLVAFALFRQGISLRVVWSSSVVRRHCHACLELRVVSQELKTHCCHRFEGIQILHLEWTRADEGALSRRRAFIIDSSKRSPEINSHWRMFSCLSSNAPS